LCHQGSPAVTESLQYFSRRRMPAVVSADHAGESTCVEHLVAPTKNVGPRIISPEEVKQHNGRGGAFWAVIDGFVVDASEFVDTHPGGLRKLLSADSPEAGATGRPFSFSFSRGRNAHFPETGQRFRTGVEQYLSAGTDQPFLPPAEVVFASYGKVVILGRLGGTDR
jgi:hypothetical protein